MHPAERRDFFVLPGAGFSCRVYVFRCRLGFGCGLFFHAKTAKEQRQRGGVACRGNSGLTVIVIKATYATGRLFPVFGCVDICNDSFSRSFFLKGATGTENGCYLDL